VTNLIGWRCTSCGLFMEDNPRYCRRCGYTVYKPVFSDDPQGQTGSSSSSGSSILGSGPVTPSSSS
jgi:hypothetical protein